MEQLELTLVADASQSNSIFCFVFRTPGQVEKIVFVIRQNQGSVMNGQTKKRKDQGKTGGRRAFC